ncbi:hypothetical protein BY458DRAFT_559932 [Sporodiniella umbellata]|nr:hypothetical protein BY458DRAFT_559932 [Sporodiniella umbellata]
MSARPEIDADIDIDVLLAAALLKNSHINKSININSNNSNHSSSSSINSSNNKKPAPKCTEKPEEVYYYACPRGTSESERAAISFSLIRTLLETSHRQKQFDALLWSLMDATFPGLVQHVMIDTPGIPDHYTFYPTEYPQALWQYMRHDTIRPMDLTEEEQSIINRVRKNRKQPMPTREEILTTAEIQNLFNGYYFRPIAKTDAVDSRDCEDFIQTASYVAILIFAIGKPPRRKNLFKFVDKGPQALLRLEKRPSPQASLFQLYPLTLELLIGVHTYFSLRVPLRIQFTSELISWTRQPTQDFARKAVISEVKLWKNVGLNHVLLIKDFLLNFSEFVLATPALLKEAEEFTMEYDAFSLNGMKYGGYDRVVLGERFTAFSSKRYLQILTLARDVTAVSDARYKGYAPNLRKSPYFDTLVEKYGIANLAGPFHSVKE